MSFCEPNASIVQLLAEIVKKEGMRGVYRGIGPGATRSFVANGAAMVWFAMPILSLSSMLSFGLLFALQERGYFGIVLV